MNGILMRGEMPDSGGQHCALARISVMLRAMQVHLTRHAEELLRDALARDPSRLSEEIIERALEAGRDLGPSPEKVRECLKSIQGVWVPDDWPGAFDDLNRSLLKVSGFRSNLSESGAECLLRPSAWVKRYVEESGSAAIHGFFQRHERMSSSTLGFVEVVAALERRLAIS